MCARTTTSERQAGTVPVGRRFGLALVTEDWSRRPEGGGPPLPPPSPPPLLIKAMLGRVDSPALSPLPLPPGPPFCDFSRIHKILSGQYRRILKPCASSFCVRPPLLCISCKFSTLPSPQKRMPRAACTWKAVHHPHPDHHLSWTGAGAKRACPSVLGPYAPSQCLPSILRQLGGGVGCFRGAG